MRTTGRGKLKSALSKFFSIFNISIILNNEKHFFSNSNIDKSKEKFLIRFKIHSLHHNFYNNKEQY